MQFASASSLYRSTTRDRSTPHARDGTARYSALVVPDEERPILRVFDHPVEEVATRTNGDFFAYRIPETSAILKNVQELRAICFRRPAPVVVVVVTTGII